MKTGLVLLGLTVLISAVGTFISQNLYDTLVFRVLIGLLCINLIVCSISRFNSAFRRSFHPPLPRNVHAVPQKIGTVLMGDPIDLHKKIEKTLKSKGYYLNSEETSDSWSFVGLKHRLGYWGAYIVHVAFVIIILGSIMGGLGFSGNFTALNGASLRFDDIRFTKGHPFKDYSIRIDSIEDRFLPNGERDNWYTGLSIIQDGKELTRGELSVNHPFQYDGVYYYQSSYSDYLKLTIEKDGKSFEDLIPTGLTANEENLAIDLSRRFPQATQDSKLYLKGLKLQNQPVVFLQADVAGGKESAILRLTTGQSETVFDQYKITLTGLTNATGLEVKADPGVPVIWFGCGMLLLGLILSFYWHPLLVSGVFIRQTEQTGALSIGMSVGRIGRQTETEFNNIIKNVSYNNSD
jgi:ResB protein required for cytochrome c biosynthesis